MSVTLRMISFGAGVQTTALAILNATGRVDNPARDLVMADTGGEKPETYAYLREHFEPWVKAHGLTLHTVRVARETLEEESLRRRMVPTIHTRWCTQNHKIRVLLRWMREHGATRKTPADVQIGISADESHRARNGWPRLYERKRWPLCEMRITRADCHQIIAEAGLPQPVKSGCWYCPFQARNGWISLASSRPDLMARAVAMEANASYRKAGEGLWAGKKLSALVSPDAQQTTFDSLIEADEQCVSGACFL